jgi:hydrogenase maturation factor HypF (carbamoyltransferase family)
VKNTFAGLVLLMVLPALLLARDTREQQRIDYLIQAFSSLKGAVFIRNGSEYDAAAARDHLRKKLSFAGERVKTAEDFIKYCASESSMTHQPYKIRFADNTTVDTVSFFRQKLQEFDQKNR